jgi:hypothetical protein
MKVFMSWSLPRSHAVAQLLGDWLQDVIQAVKPWISSADIDRGEQWFRKIGDNLAEVSVGIVCLTPENKENPWIMFESGALLKGSPEARVMTFLIDLKHQDVRAPLSQFNHTYPTKEGMFALITSLNKSLKEAALPEARLASVFATYWPQFEQKYAAIMESHQSEPEAVERPTSEILGEVLETVRGLKKQLNRMDLSDLEYGSGSVIGGLTRFSALSSALAERHALEVFVTNAMKEGLELGQIVTNAHAAGFPISTATTSTITSVFVKNSHLRFLSNIAGLDNGGEQP